MGMGDQGSLDRPLSDVAFSPSRGSMAPSYSGGSLMGASDGSETTGCGGRVSSGGGGSIFGGLLKLGRYAAASSANTATTATPPGPQYAAFPSSTVHESSAPLVHASPSTSSRPLSPPGPAVHRGWGRDLPSWLHSTRPTVRSVQVNSGEPLNAVALATVHQSGAGGGIGPGSQHGGDVGADDFVYCVGNGGLLKAIPIKETSRPYRQVKEIHKVTGHLQLPKHLGYCLYFLQVDSPGRGPPKPRDAPPSAFVNDAEASHTPHWLAQLQGAHLSKSTEES